MNVRTDPDLASKGAAKTETALAPVALSKKQLLQIAIDALTAKGPQTTYRTVKNIEGMTPAAFAEYPVAGTALEPMAAAFAAHGVPTEQTFGGTMKILHADLSVKQQQGKAHDYACYCHEQKDVMMGSAAIDILREDLLLVD